MKEKTKTEGNTKKNRAEYNLREIWADPSEIAGTIQTMEMNYPVLSNRLFIITEGPFDYEFYSKVFSGQDVVIRIANSKANVIAIIREILEDNDEFTKRSLIGIVDRDFGFFREKESDETYAAQNIFFTDTHDIETMMCSAGGLLEQVVDYYERRARFQSFAQKMQGDLRRENLREILIQAVRDLGAMVYVNNRLGAHINFKHINCKKNRNTFRYFIDSETLACDLKALQEMIVTKNSQDGPAFCKEFRDILKDHPEFFEHPWQICRGHDIMCVLLADLNERFPQQNGERIRGRDLEKTFREFYNPEEFYQTRLYLTLKSWEQSLFGGTIRFSF